jgi:positive regulator of sigma E activity
MPWPIDPLAIAGALAGCAAGLVWLRGFSLRTAMNTDYQPVVLRQHIRTGAF